MMQLDTPRHVEENLTSIGIARVEGKWYLQVALDDTVLYLNLNEAHREYLQRELGETL